jgi:hypothetical protein
MVAPPCAETINALLLTSAIAIQTLNRQLKKRFIEFLLNACESWTERF